eukprot:5829839-Karenia_brevis.AAC.1
MSPRQSHIVNALISARTQMTPRIFRYDMLMNTSPNETPGVNRQDIPKGECSNWVALCREYMRKYHYVWMKDRIMSIA